MAYNLPLIKLVETNHCRPFDNNVTSSEMLSVSKLFLSSISFGFRLFVLMLGTPTDDPPKFRNERNILTTQ